MPYIISMAQYAAASHGPYGTPENRFRYGGCLNRDRLDVAFHNQSP